MGWIIPNSATVGFAKRAARPTRRAIRRAGRGRQEMGMDEIAMEFVNAYRVLRERWAGR